VDKQRRIPIPLDWSSASTFYCFSKRIPSTVTSLGHFGGRSGFWEGPKFWTMPSNFKLCPTHFSRGANNFAGKVCYPPCAPLVTGLRMPVVTMHATKSKPNSIRFIVFYVLFIAGLNALRLMIAVLRPRYQIQSERLWWEVFVLLGSVFSSTCSIERPNTSQSWGTKA